MNDIHALSGAYAVDALDNDERAAFEAHLEQCPDCRIEVAELREATSLFGELTATPPPPSLRDSVLREISTIRPLPPLPRPGPAPAAPVAPVEEPAAVATVTPLRRRFRAPLLAAAAVIALVGGGLAVTQPWADETSQTQNAADAVLSAEDAERVTLEFPDGAKATLVRSISHQRAVLVTDDMPGPPDGKVYQIWLQTPEGDMIDAGVMPKRADQTVLLEGDASAATGAGITVEPDGGSLEPSGDPIALFDLSEAT